MTVVLREAVVVSSFLYLVCAQSDNCGTSVLPLITQGRPVAKGEYPWLAALYQLNELGKWSQFCGGALLSPRIVLTAAHCLVFERVVVKPEDLRVALGKLHRDFYHNEDYAIIANVRKVVVHRQYHGSLSSYSLDVGLLKLSVVVETSDYVLPVCIDLNTITTIRNGATVHAAGWGTSENGTSTERALAADLSYLDNYTCLVKVREAYRKYVTQEKICSLSINGSQVDRGDSGGALTFSKDGRHFVIGVVSTKVTGQTSFSIFTDLSNREIHFWLQEEIANLNSPGIDCGITVAPFHSREKPILQGEFPWLAALYLRDASGQWDQSCGGTLISPRLVLTAAHCVVVIRGKPIAADSIKVGLGKLDRDFNKKEDFSTIVDVIEVSIPPGFIGRSTNFALNVGLLKLASPIPLNNYIVPACVDWDVVDVVKPESKVHIAGWWTSATGSATNGAYAADMSYLDYQGCILEVITPYRKYLAPDKICTPSVNRSEVGRGDAGGGLTWVNNGRHFVIGVVSNKVVDTPDVSIFTKVSDPEVHSWLKAETSRLDPGGF